MRNEESGPAQEQGRSAAPRDLRSSQPEGGGTQAASEGVLGDSCPESISRRLGRHARQGVFEPRGGRGFGREQPGRSRAGLRVLKHTPGADQLLG